MSDPAVDLSDFKPDTQDMSDFKADAPSTAPSQPGVASRFWTGVKAGVGGENALNTTVDPNNPISTNPMIPGAGVYRDLKAGNVAGAAGRVVGPAAELLPMILGGRGRVAEPPPRPAPAWQTTQVPTTDIPVQMSTPEEIQAHVQRMASRPKPSAPAVQPAQTPAPATEGQSIPVGNLPIAKGNPYAGPHTPPSMEVAQSSNIQLHGYEPNSQTMLVQFKNGRVYEYKGVPQEIYDSYRTDPASQGSFFAQNIKGRYQTSFRGTVKPTAGAKIREALGGS